MEKRRRCPECNAELLEPNWNLINPDGPWNDPNTYLEVEVCERCGIIGLPSHELKRIRERTE